MKFLLYCLFPVLLFSCGQADPSPKKTPEAKNTLFKDLGELYKSEWRDTIAVFSPNSIQGKAFTGVLLDTALKHKLKPYLGEEMDYGDYFACYRFQLDAHCEGLITRAPSEYESSAIDLWIYDRNTDSIYDALRLAECFGDAGETYNQLAWLCKNTSGKWKCFTYEHKHAEPIEGDSDTTITDEKAFYIFSFEGHRVMTREITRNAFPARWNKFIEEE